MSNWLSETNTSNRFKQSYVSGFVDVSGNLIVRSGRMNILVDSSFNGNIYANATITAGKNLYVLGDASCNGNIIGATDASFSRNLYVGGNVNIVGTDFRVRDVFLQKTSLISGTNTTLTVPLSQVYNITTTTDTFITLPSISAYRLEGSEITFYKSASNTNNITLLADAFPAEGIVTYGTVLSKSTFEMPGSKTSVKFVVATNRWIEVGSSAIASSDGSFVNMVLKGNLFVFRDASFGGNLFGLRDASFGGNLFVLRDASFGSNLTVIRDASFGGNVFVRNMRLDDVSVNSRNMTRGNATTLENVSTTSTTFESSSIATSYDGRYVYYIDNNRTDGTGNPRTIYKSSNYGATFSLMYTYTNANTGRRLYQLTTNQTGNVLAMGLRRDNNTGTDLLVFHDSVVPTPTEYTISSVSTAKIISLDMNSTGSSIQTAVYIDSTNKGVYRYATDKRLVISQESTNASFAVQATGLAVTSDNTRAVVAFMSANNGVQFSTRTGTTWSPFTTVPVVNSATNSVSGGSETYLAMTPDGNRIFVTVQDGFSYFSTWNSTTGTYNALAKTLETTTKMYAGASLTADGSRALTNLSHNSFHLASATWNGANYSTFGNVFLSTVSSSFPSSGYLYSAISHDGKRIGFGYNGSSDPTNSTDGYYISILNESTGSYGTPFKTLDTVTNRTYYTSRFSSDGNTLFVGTRDNATASIYYATWNGTNYSAFTGISTSVLPANLIMWGVDFTDKLYALNYANNGTFYTINFNYNGATLISAGNLRSEGTDQVNALFQTQTLYYNLNNETFAIPAKTIASSPAGNVVILYNKSTAQQSITTSIVEGAPQFTGVISANIPSGFGFSLGVYTSSNHGGCVANTVDNSVKIAFFLSGTDPTKILKVVAVSDAITKNATSLTPTCFTSTLNIREICCSDTGQHVYIGTATGLYYMYDPSPMTSDISFNTLTLVSGTDLSILSLTCSKKADYVYFSTDKKMYRYISANNIVMDFGKTANPGVGIRKSNPQVELDVAGSVKMDKNLFVNTLAVSNNQMIQQNPFTFIGSTSIANTSGLYPESIATSYDGQYVYYLDADTFAKLLQNKPPWGIYTPNDYSNNVWKEARGNGRDATTVNVSVSSASGNGATGSIAYLSGTTTSSITWPTGSIPDTFTLFTIARRLTSSGRLFVSAGTTSNWVHGFVNSLVGRVYYDKEMSSAFESIILKTNWIVQGGRNKGTTLYNVMTNGEAKGTGTSGTGNLQLGINIPTWSNEFCSFQVSDVLIWDQALTDDEMVLVSDKLMQYLVDGLSLSTIYKSTDMYTRVIRSLNYGQTFSEIYSTTATTLTKIATNNSGSNVAFQRKKHGTNATGANNYTITYSTSATASTPTFGNGYTETSADYHSSSLYYTHGTTGVNGQIVLAGYFGDTASGVKTLSAIDSTTLGNVLVASSNLATLKMYGVKSLYYSGEMFSLFYNSTTATTEPIQFVYYLPSNTSGSFSGVDFNGNLTGTSGTVSGIKVSGNLSSYGVIAPSPILRSVDNNYNTTNLDGSKSTGCSANTLDGSVKLSFFISHKSPTKILKIAFDGTTLLDSCIDLPGITITGVCCGENGQHLYIATTTGLYYILDTSPMTSNIASNKVLGISGTENMNITAIACSKTSEYVYFATSNGATENKMYRIFNNILLEYASNTRNLTLKPYSGVVSIRNLVPDSNYALDVGGNINATGLRLTGTADSTGIGSGALQVSGGVGIAKNTYIGGNVIVGGNVIIAKKNRIYCNQDISTTGQTLTFESAENINITSNVVERINLPGIPGSEPYFSEITYSERNHGTRFTFVKSYTSPALVDIMIYVYGKFIISKSGRVSESYTFSASETYLQLICISNTEWMVCNQQSTGGLSNLNSDNTDTVCYIPFSKTTNPTGNQLFIDNTAPSLTYNPSTSVLSAGNVSAGNVHITSSTESTSTSTGAFRVSGGVGIGSNLYVGGNTTISSTTVSSNTTSGALVVSGGVGISKNVYIGGNTNITSTTESTSAGTGALVVSGGVGINGKVYINKETTISSTTVSSNTTSGALVVSGGVGISNNVYIGGNTNITSTTVSSGTTSGALVVSGGVGIGSKLYVGGDTNISSSAESTSTSTGALQVSGGVGIAKNTYIGGGVIVGGNVIIAKKNRIYCNQDISTTNQTLTFESAENINITSNGVVRINLPTDAYTSSNHGTRFTFVKSYSPPVSITIYAAGSVQIISKSATAQTYTFSASETYLQLICISNTEWMVCNQQSTGGLSNLNSDSTSNTVCYIPFSKTTNPTGNQLFIGNTEPFPLAYNPSTYSLSVGNAIMTGSAASTTTTTGALRVSGGAGIAGTVTAASFNATSDRRLKTDIRSLPSQWENIKRLRPSEYTWNKTSLPDYGFIAQEVFEIYPHMRQPLHSPISESSTLDAPVDIHGEPQYYSLDYGKMTATLCKGLQEAIHTIETQHREIDELKQQVRILLAPFEPK